MKNLLVVVDYQNDFVCGALGFEGAQNLEAGICQEVEKTLEKGDFVLFTRDTHGQDYLSTREGKHLPLPHCIKGQKGHSLFGGLCQWENSKNPKVKVLDKPTFGSLEIAGAAAQLCGQAPCKISICGLVTDICVVTNALILHTGFPLAKVQVLGGLCGSANKENAQKALDLLLGMGIDVV